MRMVRGRAEARWMPSRYGYALFQLFAYFRLRNAKPEPRDAILVLDRHQSNVETWIVCWWLIGTTACAIAGTLFAKRPLPVALAISLLLAIVGIQALAVASGLVIAPLWKLVTRLDTPGMNVTSIVLVSLIGAACAYCTTRPGWVRFAGWQFFVVLALNALAAAIVFLMGDAIARAEESVGGVVSGR